MAINARIQFVELGFIPSVPGLSQEIKEPVLTEARADYLKSNW